MTHQAHQSGVAHVNNTELYYDVGGSGHPLTLIHGMLLDRRSWDDQFEMFARQYRVLRYDMQGWGDSAQEQAEPPFSPRQDLLSLLDSLNIQKTFLLGLSGGGALALDFTLEHPDKVDALILVASGLSGYPQRMTETIQAFIAQYYGALQQHDSASAVEAQCASGPMAPGEHPSRCLRRHGRVSQKCQPSTSNGTATSWHTNSTCFRSNRPLSTGLRKSTYQP